MPELDRFVRVDFQRFKAFRSFSLRLRSFNVLVGPNNAGKSTILAAFRVLAARLRGAMARRPTFVAGPQGKVLGYVIDLRPISVAEENIFHNYDDSVPASVRFRLSSGNELLLYFPEQESCYLIADAGDKRIDSPTLFRQSFNCPIGFVPILGPVDHNEPLYQRDAARLALFSYTAARNFRNIWHHFPERFEEFRQVLRDTWPGMDIERPTVDFSHERPRLHMFCPEDRIPRELFWSGFGFQVWCQMLTHLMQSRDSSLFLIDEPDIYIHSDLQRQLLGLLRNLGPDILIATHSTEIISEAEPDDIVLVNKAKQSARRINQPAQLEDIFSALGSQANPLLTQLAKTRKAVFVEGRDFSVLSAFARKLGFANVANRSDFAVVTINGFSIDRARSIKAGIELTLGGQISVAVILDRDYRSEEERNHIGRSCQDSMHVCAIHDRREIENFLLVPSAIDRAADRRCAERARRSGTQIHFTACAVRLLSQFAAERRSYVMAQCIDFYRRFRRGEMPQIADATVTEAALVQFEARWANPLDVIPGKDALSALNHALQHEFGVGVTPTSIIDAMNADEVAPEMRDLLVELNRFASRRSRIPRRI